MDRNVYQSELDRVRFTEAGKSALTDALMTGRAESEQRRGRRATNRARGKTVFIINVSIRACFLFPHEVVCIRPGDLNFW